MFRSRGAREKKKRGSMLHPSFYFFSYAVDREINTGSSDDSGWYVCLFRCTHCLPRSTTVSKLTACMFDAGVFFLSLSLSLTFRFLLYSAVVMYHRTRSYMRECERGWIRKTESARARARESEREREREIEYIDQAKVSFSLYACVCVSLSVGPRRLDSSSRSFTYHSRSERMTTIECNLISSNLANQCACRKVERERERRKTCIICNPGEQLSVYICRGLVRRRLLPL